MRRAHPRLLTTFLVALAGLSLILLSCGRTRAVSDAWFTPIDRDATIQTRALLANMSRLSPDYLLFGHQDDLAYGVHWKREPGRSDVLETAGAYPAVYGWELGDLELGAEQNLDGVRFDDMRRWILEGYGRGGVITIGWHLRNPASGGNAWDTTRAIHTAIPGGEHHEAYRATLDRFAEFVGGLQAGSSRWLDRGHPVPIIFRPFHEMTGSWFWWGRRHVTPEEFVRLWQFTVDYLRNEKGLHNLLYAYSTDVFATDEQYLEHYPGDDYVDILGVDDYHSLRSDEGVAELSARLRRLVEIADARGKVAAMTETGFEGIPYPQWWTGRLLRGIQADSVARRIAYVLVWRNANDADIPGHHYAPYPGHPSAPDFVEFRNDPFVLFEPDLPDMYRMPR
jgi:mannan endo-1,4-beta-mannosidase